jgi:acylphosphatase
MSERTVLLAIAGRVQGVGYRDWTVGTARRLGVRGWVRNRVDGSVEALVGGDSASVERMIEACRRGPPGSRVERVDVADAETADLPERFMRQPTA